MEIKAIIGQRVFDYFEIIGLSIFVLAGLFVCCAGIMLFFDTRAAYRKSRWY